MLDRQSFERTVESYKRDKESVYNTWFTNNEERLKAFRAIRRGVQRVVQDVKDGTFGTDFKGSSLETVLTSITEQKQVFEGAAHPFYWKPKLRIPDIYENEANKRTFAQFLEACLNASREEQIIREVLRLSQQKIKGLGPAVANILYFLHPMLVPPSNTAMVNGFNLLFKDKRKLSSWDSYLQMRDTLLQVNDSFQNLLSKDLGAISGLLYEVGTGRIVIEGNAELVIEKERRKAEELRSKRHAQVEAEIQEESKHTQIEYLLLKVGMSLGYDVIVASNDRNKSYEGQAFSFMCLRQLPSMEVPNDVLRTIELIDVLWFEKGTNKIVCAFEVEKSTSIVTGIWRMTDLALTLTGAKMLCLVAPDEREREVIAQLKRPSISAQKDVAISYILFSDICEHCEAICRFGNDYTILEKIAKR